MYTTLAARRDRFTRDTVPEDYAARARELEMIRRARGTTPPDDRRPKMPPGDKAALIVAVVILVLIAGSAW